VKTAGALSLSDSGNDTLLVPATTSREAVPRGIALLNGAVIAVVVSSSSSLVVDRNRIDTDRSECFPSTPLNTIVTCGAVDVRADGEACWIACAAALVMNAKAGCPWPTSTCLPSA